MEAKLLYICPIVLLSLLISYFWALTYKMPESLMKLGLQINIGAVNSFDIQAMSKEMKEELRGRLVVLLMLGIAATLVVGGIAMQLGSTASKAIGVGAIVVQGIVAFGTMVAVAKRANRMKRELLEGKQGDRQ